MAQPARHRETAGKIQLPAVQGWGAVQHQPDSSRGWMKVQWQVTGTFNSFSLLFRLMSDEYVQKINETITASLELVDAQGASESQP